MSRSQPLHPSYSKTVMQVCLEHQAATERYKQVWDFIKCQPPLEAFENNTIGMRRRVMKSLETFAEKGVSNKKSLGKHHQNGIWHAVTADPRVMALNLELWGQPLHAESMAPHGNKHYASIFGGGIVKSTHKQGLVLYEMLLFVYEKMGQQTSAYATAPAEGGAITPASAVQYIDNMLAQKRMPGCAQDVPLLDARLTKLTGPEADEARSDIQECKRKQAAVDSLTQELKHKKQALDKVIKDLEHTLVIPWQLELVEKLGFDYLKISDQESEGVTFRTRKHGPKSFTPKRWGKKQSVKGKNILGKEFVEEPYIEVFVLLHGVWYEATPYSDRKFSKLTSAQVQQLLADDTAVETVEDVALPPQITCIPRNYAHDQKLDALRSEQRPTYEQLLLSLAKQCIHLERSSDGAFPTMANQVKTTQLLLDTCSLPVGRSIRTSRVPEGAEPPTEENEDDEDGQNHLYPDAGIGITGHGVFTFTVSSEQMDEAFTAAAAAAAAGDEPQLLGKVADRNNVQEELTVDFPYKPDYEAIARKICLSDESLITFCEQVPLGDDGQGCRQNCRCVFNALTEWLEDVHANAMTQFNQLQPERWLWKPLTPSMHENEMYQGMFWNMKCADVQQLLVMVQNVVHQMNRNCWTNIPASKTVMTEAEYYQFKAFNWEDQLQNIVTFDTAQLRQYLSSVQTFNKETVIMLMKVAILQLRQPKLPYVLSREALIKDSGLWAWVKKSECYSHYKN